jgi:hypothetical protein
MMARLKRGRKVVLLRRLTRGRRHDYGRVKLRRGSVGQVVERHDRLLRGARYDVRFDRKSSGQVVRGVPASSLRARRRLRLSTIVWLLIVVAIVYYALKA